MARPFVGRAAELAELQRALEQAAAGRGGTYLIAGEPGIGKTRLCDRASNAASGLAMHVLWGRCWEAGGAPAYWPWLEVLHSLASGLGVAELPAVLGEGAAAFLELLPSLRERVPELGAAATKLGSPDEALDGERGARARSARARSGDATAQAAQPARGRAPVAVGAQERHASAYFYGLQLDEETLRAEVQKIIAFVKQKKPVKPIAVTDAATARADISQTLGFVPSFLSRVPDPALPGVWREMKELKLSPSTRLNAKTKALISLAVASQVPSQGCVIAETELAKLAGATDREIAEAVGMAAITRNMSTLLNGVQVDMRGFVADIDKLVAGVKKAAKAQARKAQAEVANAKR